MSDALQTRLRRMAANLPASAELLEEAAKAVDRGEIMATALRFACEDGWADAEGARAGYIRDAEEAIADVRAILGGAS